MSHVSCLTVYIPLSNGSPPSCSFRRERERKKASATEFAVCIRVNCIKDIIYVAANESRIVVTHVCIHLQVVCVDTYSCTYALISSVSIHLLVNVYTYL